MNSDKPLGFYLFRYIIDFKIYILSFSFRFPLLFVKFADLLM